MRRILFSLLAVSAAALGASAGAQARMGAHTVSVTITNTSSNQAFSAPVVVSHSKGYQPFALGEPAYPELVPLAEDGMTAEFVTVAKMDPAILDYAVAMHALAPGQSVTLKVQVDDAHPLLSVFGMMVATNGAVFYYGTDLATSGMVGSAGANGMASTGSAGMGAGAMAAKAGGSDAVDASGMAAKMTGAGASSADAQAKGAGMTGQGMMAQVDLYDGTVRILVAGSKANTESCQDMAKSPLCSVGAQPPVATVTLATP